nr:MAG TPA: helix-turn-helix domain protein [Caudoviricetes sp.]
MLRLLTFGLLHNLEGLFLFYFRYVDLCNKINKSPSAVAEELGFKRSSVTRWANNSVPRQATLQKIADYFGVTVEYLKGEETKKDPGQKTEAEIDGELLEIWNTGDEDEHRALLEMARLIKSRRNKK